MRDFKINRDKKTFIFDDGEELPIPEEDVKSVLRTQSGRKLKEKEKEGYKKTHGGAIGTFKASMDESILGNPAETFVNYLKSGGKGLFKGEGQEELGFVDRVLDNFYSLQEGRKEAISELQQESPTATKFGKGVGTVGELALLGATPAKYALPIMGMGHSETSFLEPGKKSLEVGQDALVGLVLDKFFKGLGNFANQRGARRAAKEGIAQAETANAAELARVEGLNAAEKARFAQDTAAREAQLLQQPALQETANQGFFLNSMQNLGRALKNIGKQAIGAETAGVEEFIANSINTTGRAASKEGNFASRFLRTVFKGDKDGKLTAESIKKGMKALDEGIAAQGGLTREILTDYKNFLLKRLPENLSTGFAFAKWSPRIVGKTIQNLENQVSKILSTSPLVSQEISGKLGASFSQKMVDSFEKAAKKVLEKYKGNIPQALAGGGLEQEIVAAIRATPEYQKIFNSVSNFKFAGKGSGAKAAQSIDPAILKRSIPGLVEVEQAISSLPETIGQRFLSATQEALPEISRDLKSVLSSTTKNLRNVPSAPQIPPEPPPVSPLNIESPNLQALPSIPEPQGTMGKLAHGLESLREKPLLETLKNLKGVGGLGILGALAGLPMKTVGGAAIGGYGAARALTSPSTAGNVLRSALEIGSRPVYIAEEMARKYPSYENGILMNPEERRSLVREIEDNPELTLSEKALLQSKINRGKPLKTRLN